MRKLQLLKSGPSTIKLLFVGALCTFAGLILLAATHAMIDRSPPEPVNPAASAEAAPQAKEPARIARRSVCRADRLGTPMRG